MFWTTASLKISQLQKRVRVVQGGTSAGKTFAILQILIGYCCVHPFHVSIVAESIPHLRRGALKDFLKLLAEAGMIKDSAFNKSTLTYTFDNGSMIEFFSADQPDKLRGARRDILFINECNNIDYEAYLQMEVRTKKFVILDYNPTHEFWVHDEVMKSDHDFIKLTYKDNEALDGNIIASIESKKHNEWWWTVYGLGEVGRLEGAIFKNWEEGDFDDNLVYSFGLDFGWEPDPTAMSKVAIDEVNKKIYVKELCYANKLTQENIAEVLRVNTKPNDCIIADSADKRIIDSMYDKGFNVVAAEKGPGSIREGIMFIQDYKIIVDKDSHNLKKELLNYCWSDKRAGIPIDKHNHLCDSIRMAIEKLRTPSFYFG
jgi:phage terminase large subunit